MRSAATDPRTAGAPLVDATGISFRYARGEPVLEDVDLRLEPGEFVALVGPNGSGKSTLLRIVLGALQADAGDVRLLGEHPDRVEDRSRIGYVPQRSLGDPEVPATVDELVATGRLGRRPWWRRPSVADREAIRHAISSVGLDGLARTPVSELSGGQRQRVFIARAYAGEPEVLLLDEPIAGVDAASQRRFRESLTHLVREHGAGVLLVSHELSAVAGALDRVVVLKRRVLFDGTPDELAATGVHLGVHREDLPTWLEELG